MCMKKFEICKKKFIYLFEVYYLFNNTDENKSKHLYLKTNVLLKTKTWRITGWHLRFY